MLFLGVQDTTSHTKFSLRWLGANKKHWYKCMTCNHMWPTKPTHTHSGSGCPVCAKNVKATIEECKKIAKEKLNGGRCLDSTYVNARTRMLWECGKCKHHWMTTYSAIKSRTGCPKCNQTHSFRKDTYTYEDAKISVKHFNIATQKQYKEQYKQDPQLPSDPYDYYKRRGTWVNWLDFLGKGRKCDEK